MDSQKKIIPQYISSKAGMSSVNAQTIAKKVAELTNGTPKDLHQKQLQRKRAIEVVSMLEKVMKYKKEDRQEIKLNWITKIKQLNQSRNLQKHWGHFDFDMFYVACQLLEKPQYKNLPCGVGGENSVLCTANYAARLFGVRSAMPTFIAKKLCPELILFKPDFDKYRKFSQIFRESLRKYDHNLQSHGLDQAYVDLTQWLKDKNKQEKQIFINNIRKQIYDKTQLTVSCGIGANKMLAKIGSQVNKPNGQYIIQNNSEIIQQFMKDKKVRKIPGIGPVNQYFLKGLKIQSALQILQNTDILSICFSQNSCQFFISAALGLGPLQHQFKERKSVGKSQTFRPTSDKQFLQHKLLQLCQQVSHQLEELGFISTNVVLSYQLQNYDRKDKTFNLQRCSKQKQSLFQSTINHLKDYILVPGKKIRLLGVKCTSLMKLQEWKRKSLQSFFAKTKEKQKQKKEMKPQKIQKIQKIQQTQKKDSGKKDSQKNELQNKIYPHNSMSKDQQLINQIKQKSQFICPICNQQVNCMNNLSAFNRHIDKCLKMMK